jgi:hypothetical protein
LINWLKLSTKIILNSANGSKDTLILITPENHITQSREERDNNYSILWEETKLLHQERLVQLIHRELEKFILEKLLLKTTEDLLVVQAKDLDLLVLAEVEPQVAVLAMPR